MFDKGQKRSSTLSCDNSYIALKYAKMIFYLIFDILMLSAIFFLNL